MGGSIGWYRSYISKNPEPSPLALPRRFEQAALSHMPEGLLKDKVVEYTACNKFPERADAGIGCLFLGVAGTYKTYAAAIIAREVHAFYKLPTLFVQCPVWFSRLERNRFSKESEDMVRGITMCPFVVMDDFSQVVPGSFAAGVLLEVAEARFSNLLPTLWTGNISVASVTPQDMIGVLSNLYGPSFGRRVVETSTGFRVYLK